jgi:hypothetical protein
MPEGKWFDIASNSVNGVIEGGHMFMTAITVPRKYSPALKTLNILNSRIQRARDSVMQSMRILLQGNALCRLRFSLIEQLSS